jgi:TPP-dependent pyruvate/acetoin dehydrogenase alpha subunit
MSQGAATKTRPGRLPKRAEAIEMYRRMRLIRDFEELVQALFLKGEVPGTTHLGIGQEADSVGVCSALAEADRVAATYRGHSQALALGVQPQALLDELLGRSTGVCAGRAGSMNVVDLSHRLIGCFSIVGGSIAAATGAALALRRAGGVAVAFFGEGAVNQGYFPECLNFAQVLALPVLYVCENNRYGEFTPFETVTAGEILERPRVFGIAAEQVDGMDVYAVRRATEKALRRARDGGGPQFIESLTYRFVGHSRADPAKYRKPGELDEWKERDPLTVARERLVEEAGVKSEELDEIDAETETLIAEMRAEGLSAPMPDPEVLREASEFKE